MKRAIIVSIFTFTILLTSISNLSAQTASGNNSTVQTREQMVQLLRYLELNKVADAATVDKLVESWTEAAKPGLSTDKRTAVLRDLFIQFYKLHGVDYSDRPQAMSGLVQFAVSSFRGNAQLDLRLPEPRGPVSGDYIHVEKKGRGPAPMMLISISVTSFAARTISLTLSNTF